MRQTDTACVYDDKTGQRGLGQVRAVQLASAAQRIDSDTRRVIIIQVRPRS